MFVQSLYNAPVTGYLRIGELARRTGVGEATLRAWERRYALLQPDRSEGGFRLYTDEDVARVAAMRSQLARGIAASEAARIALEPPRAPNGRAADTLRDELTAALAALDDVAAQQVLDRTLATLSVEGAVREVLLPVMSEVGAGWERDSAAIAREHFATNVVRSRLVGLARGWDLGGGRRALLACAPEELHDLGLIAFGIALRARGWRVTYLGANTPVETLAAAAQLVAPDLIVVSASTEERLARAVPHLRRLAGDHRLAVGGPGATANTAQRVGAELLAGDPFAAASAF